MVVSVLTRDLADDVNHPKVEPWMYLAIFFDQCGECGDCGDSVCWFSTGEVCYRWVFLERERRRRWRCQDKIREILSFHSCNFSSPASSILDVLNCCLQSFNPCSLQLVKKGYLISRSFLLSKCTYVAKTLINLKHCKLFVACWMLSVWQAWHKCITASLSETMFFYIYLQKLSSFFKFFSNFSWVLLDL